MKRLIPKGLHGIVSPSNTISEEERKRRAEITEKFWKGEILQQNPIKKEEKEEPKIQTEEEDYDLLKDVSNFYKDFSDSNLGTVYDTVNVIAYLFPPTQLLAAGMTGLQAAGALADVYKNGWNLNNTIDILSAIPGFNLSEKAVKFLSPKLMARFGKNMKYVNKAYKELIPKSIATKASNYMWKNFPKISQKLKIMHNDPLNFRKSLFEMAKQNKAYRPVASLIYGEKAANQALNLYQIGNDLKDTVDKENLENLSFTEPKTWLPLTTDVVTGTIGSIVN